MQRISSMEMVAEAQESFLVFFFLEQQGWSGVVGMFTAPYYLKVVGWLSMHFFIIIIIII